MTASGPIDRMPSQSSVSPGPLLFFTPSATTRRASGSTTSAPTRPTVRAEAVFITGLPSMSLNRITAPPPGRAAAPG